ncbi:MAG: adenylosuccinate synthetase, partial [Desulfobacteraceae bacterium]|nr:adenylosuccinate synthetase [Desulfobacteraceae bacterium]
ERIRKVGGEFGATTGRPRRCGWLDILVVRGAVRLNGLSGLVITKLDVLTGIPKLKIATSYLCRGSRLDCLPPQLSALEACEPVFEEFPGWEESISKARKWDDLPRNTQNYLRAIEEMAGVPIQIVSVGPGREETIMVRNPYES